MTTLVQITDLHMRPIDKLFCQIVDTNGLAFNAFSALKPLSAQIDGIVITGDLTNDGAESEYAGLAHQLTQLDCPVFTLPGNHDNPALMRKLLTNAGPLENGAEDKIYYAVQVGDLTLICLDSSVPGEPYGNLGSTQLSWLEAQITSCDTPVVIALHHPPIATGLAKMDAIGLRDSPAFQKIIEKAPCVSRIICGHVHRPIFANFAGVTVTIAPSTAHQLALDLTGMNPPEFSLEPPAYFLHHYTKNAGLITHMAYFESYPGPYPFDG